MHYRTHGSNFLNCALKKVVGNFPAKNLKNRPLQGSLPYFGMLSFLNFSHIWKFHEICILLRKKSIRYDYSYYYLGKINSIPQLELEFRPISVSSIHTNCPYFLNIRGLPKCWSEISIWIIAVTVNDNRQYVMVWKSVLSYSYLLSTLKNRRNHNAQVQKHLEHLQTGPRKSAADRPPPSTVRVYASLR
jgi:hypothetical protein